VSTLDQIESGGGAEQTDVLSTCVISPVLMAKLINLPEPRFESVRGRRPLEGTAKRPRPKVFNITM
jgi:hypothetical protein